MESVAAGETRCESSSWIVEYLKSKDKELDEDRREGWWKLESWELPVTVILMKKQKTSEDRKKILALVLALDVISQLIIMDRCFVGCEDRNLI